jgi:signal transduction histidine kinase
MPVEWRDSDCLRDALERTLDALESVVPLAAAKIMLLEDGGLTEAAHRGHPDLGGPEEIREPLLSNGNVLGVLFVRCEPSSEPHRDTVRALVPLVSVAVENAMCVERQANDIEQIEDEERHQREFLSIVSHELRTPLSVVMGYTETLAQYIDRLDPEEIVSISARTRDAGRRLARLIGDLFDLAQTDRGQLDVSLYPTSVERVLQQAPYEVPGDRHRLEVLCEPDLPPVLVDRDRLNQVLVNLVSNAKKYSPEGSSVTVAATREKDEVAITVADEGAGIPPEATEKIFDRFYQFEDESHRRGRGMGVGLYLVKEICERMNATVEVDSEVGRGTLFTVRVPVAEGLAS